MEIRAIRDTRLAQEVAEADPGPFGRPDGTGIPWVAGYRGNRSHVGAPIAGTLHRRRDSGFGEAGTEVAQRQLQRDTGSALDGQASGFRVEVRLIAVRADIEVLRRGPVGGPQSAKRRFGIVGLIAMEDQASLSLG